MMMRLLIGTVMITLAVGCARSVGSPASRSASATARTPIERLQAVLDANPQIETDVCERAARLADVGWPEQTIPSLLHPYLTTADLEKLQESGLPLNRALVEVVRRC
jgi:hypothetical protein